MYECNGSGKERQSYASQLEQEVAAQWLWLWANDWKVMNLNPRMTKLTIVGSMSKNLNSPLLSWIFSQFSL